MIANRLSTNIVENVTIKYGCGENQHRNPEKYKTKVYEIMITEQ